MNSYERKRRICKVIVLVLGILSINNIILTIRNYSYAYFEKNVKTGVKLKITTLDEMPSKGAIATKVIKDTIGTTGGVIGITNDNQPTTIESDNIREYRYSENIPKNYIYFNCQDGTTYETASSNCEVWRIVGVFEDESNNEHLKIVNNNSVASKKPYSNDWTRSSINTYLNTTYYNSLSEDTKDIIDETKYYLGNVATKNDTVGSSYIHERGSSACSSSCSGGDVWEGNQATWIGKIALLYPSDYGFMSSNEYWNQKLSSYSGMPRFSNWLYNADSGNEWFLSPSSEDSNSIAGWRNDGSVYYFDAYYGGITEVRPCLYLKSNVRILEETTGEKTNPYFLSL